MIIVVKETKTINNVDNLYQQCGQFKEKEIDLIDV